VPRTQTLFALALYTGFTVYLTWPLITDLGSTFYISPTRPEGDYHSVTAYFRELVEGPHNPFAAGRIEDFNAPHGSPILWINNAANFPTTIVLFAMTAVFGATAGFGLFAMAGFVASALAMFLFVRKYTGSPGVATVIGFAYGFYPYVVANGEHPYHIHGWVFVVMVWRLLELLQRPTVRNGVFAGAACVLALAWVPYFLLLGGVLYATVVVVGLGAAAVRRELRPQLLPNAVCLSFILAYIAIVGLSVLVESNAVATAQSSIFDIFAQTARPLNYIVPSGHNLVTGGLTDDFLLRRGWLNNAEKSLYVGISVMLLALVGGIALLLRRLDRRASLTVLTMSAAALVALAFSAPPKVGVGGFVVELPSYYVWSLQPSWRIYSRFVIIVMLGLCIVAAFGLQALRQGRSPRVSAAILAAAAVVVPLDLWAKFEPNTRKLTMPPIYETLRAQPPGIVAEYPIQVAANAENYDEIYNQQYHDKPILNGFPPRSADERRALRLANLSRPRTAERLAERGVRYVLLRHRVYPYSPRPGRPRAGFELIERSDFADLYRVAPGTAQPGSR
jgi:hypothetical protein